MQRKKAINIVRLCTTIAGICFFLIEIVFLGKKPLASVWLGELGQIVMAFGLYFFPNFVGKKLFFAFSPFFLMEVICFLFFDSALFIFPSVFFLLLMVHGSLLNIQKSRLQFWEAKRNTLYENRFYKSETFLSSDWK